MSYRGPSDQYNSESSEDSDSDSLFFNRTRNLPYSKSLIDSELNNLILSINKSIEMPETPNSLNVASVSGAGALPILKKDYLGMIPEFEGQAELLPRFIEISEKLVNKFYNKVDVTDFQNEYLMSSILAKIKGEAAVNISSCIINNWNDLKLALLNAYADKRDIYTLNLEMTECKQENESPFEFYTRIQQLLNLQTSYITTHSQGAECVILITYHRNLALRVLLRGLKDPLGSLMRTKNPTDLNSALGMLTNDFQIETARNKFSKTKISNNKPTSFQNRSFKTNYQPQLQLTNFSHNPRTMQRSASYNQNAGPSTNQNVFRPNQAKNLPKPVPMSVSTTNTYRPGQNSQFQNHNYRPNQYHIRNNNNIRPNYVVEELFNIDDQPSVELPDEDYYDDNSENAQNEFFHEKASDYEYVDPDNNDPQISN